jgi:hypothetical protein
MSDTPSVQAERLLEQALASTGARDPREFYRERLKELKQADPGAYGEAVAYYRDTLIPTIAGGEADPLDAWTEYGRRLAVALVPGSTVSVDATGRARPFERRDPGDLILQIPDGKGGRALLIGLPAEPSSAQKATYDVLVEGRQRAVE